MKLIILTKEQADKIRGRYGRYSALEPIKLPDGLFMLPERCLSDVDLKDAYQKLNEAKQLNGVKELLKVSEVQKVKKDEYYLFDEGIAKCKKDADKKEGIEKDETIFIQPIRPPLEDIELIKK